MKKSTQIAIAFTFGVMFLVTLILLAIFFPTPTPFQYTVFRVVLALAAAGAAAMIPGFLQVNLSDWIRAGGAIAVFVVVFFYNPATLIAPVSDDRVHAITVEQRRIQQAKAFEITWLSEGSLPEITPNNPWPLKLEGLQYQRLVTYAGGREDNTLDADWYKEHWLEKSEFSSQTYKQMADALEREDKSDVAAEILYASKEKQRARAEGLRWFNLTLQKILIGYGYRIYQALFWFGWFVALGALVHLRVKAKPKQGLADLAESLFFSFDWLTPIVKLDETHYKDPFHGWQRYYFAVHILIGFVLVSFILAGVSGLTK